MNNELLALAKTAKALVNDKLDILKVTDESLQPFGARPATPPRTVMFKDSAAENISEVANKTLNAANNLLSTPRFTQEQLHNALSDIVLTTGQTSYLYMTGEDITDLVCQYPNNSFACMYGDTAISISSRNRIMSTIVYGVGRSMSIGDEVTLSDMLLLSINTMPTLAETAEIAKCITSALQCLDANAPNNDTHIGGPVE